MTPIDAGPSLVRASLNFVAIRSNACSQVAGTNLPSRLISGCWRRSWIVGEVEGVASLDAQEVAVDAALVAIVAAHNLHAGIGAAHAQRGLAAVAAMRADGADVLHLPRPRLVAISAGGERADRADVDAHAALFALQMVFFIGRDDRAASRGSGCPAPRRPCLRRRRERSGSTGCSAGGRSTPPATTAARRDGSSGR